MTQSVESGATVGDLTLRDRVVDIEILLAELGFAAVVDPDAGSITAVAKAPAGPDPQALWRLITAKPAARLSEGDLRSEDYLLIALGKLAPHS